MNFAQQYKLLLTDLMGSMPIIEKNTRTGHQVRVWPGMRAMNIGLANWELPTCGVRKTNPHVAAAENAWCLLGHDHVQWLSQHTKVWNAFADPTGKMKESYGNRWSNTFGHNQLSIALDRLNSDHSDRRIWISSWDPGSDILDLGQKTVPCPVGFTLQVMNDRLWSTYVLRSSDAFLGLPHDVMRHSYLMAAVASSLNIGLGVLSVAIANSHIYDVHWDLANHVVDNDIKLTVPMLGLPKTPVHKIVENPNEYVYRVKMAQQLTVWPDWNPIPELVK